jgi:hypothetical protein
LPQAKREHGEQQMQGGDTEFASKQGHKPAKKQVSPAVAKVAFFGQPIEGVLNDDLGCHGYFL